MNILVTGLMLLQPIFHGTNQTAEPMIISYHPIGEFHTLLTPQTGAPRQGTLQPGVEGTIEIYEEYQEALRDLEKYEYIIVLYHLHLSRDWHPDVRPPGSKESMGLFATRTPNRPNPIGFGVIKLNRIEGNTLQVSGMDAFNGTPVLDIKPWIQSIDCPSNQTNTDIERDLGLKKEENK
jgi:tRNA-Thr(GGU) m(6)t(6)A37 methyltransferase TsaA